ncbi:hypothetical protein AVEN_12784-1 [Araneus ventricosus]|uniref:Uncharacterized protein n=1 Tax=Araneus ventricosus TaxID=182803 RepID=A0A4Y2ADV1_ARAVE|nr:hypothetical protein AVEN_12784-1 [Araneus ventricosus]
MFYFPARAWCSAFRAELWTWEPDKEASSSHIRVSGTFINRKTSLSVRSIRISPDGLIYPSKIRSASREWASLLLTRYFRSFSEDRVGLRVERRHHLQSVCLQDVILLDQTDKNRLGLSLAGQRFLSDDNDDDEMMTTFNTKS